MKGPRIVIPTVQRERTLGNLHVGHQGITAMQQMAKTTVYWPGIDADIEDWVQRCTACLATKPKPEERTTSTTPSPRWTLAEDRSWPSLTLKARSFYLSLTTSANSFLWRKSQQLQHSPLSTSFATYLHQREHHRYWSQIMDLLFNSSEFRRFCQEGNP